MSHGHAQSCTSLAASPLKLVLTASQCNPFSLTYSVLSADCPAVSSSGYTQFVVSDPNPVATPPGLMCQSFAVLLCDGTGLAGATVTVSASEGGTPVASGVTSVGGNLYLTWQGAPGSYYVAVTAPGQPSQSGTLTLRCSGEVVFRLTVPGSQECCDGCSVPPLTLTDANGSYPLNYDSTQGYWTVLVGSTGHATADSYIETACFPPNNIATTINESGNAAVLYIVQCVAGNKYHIIRWWFQACYYDPGFLCPGYDWVINFPGPTSQPPCPYNTAYWDYSVRGSIPFLPGFFTGGFLGSAQGTFNFSCSPFSASGNLTQLSGGIADPVGGTVVIEATAP